jgi:WD40 repeat protein
MNVPSIPDIAGLLSDVYRAFLAYANPITSHALQVYQSVLATGPSCRLVDHHTRRGEVVAPRLVSQRRSDWISLVSVSGGHESAVSSGAYSPDVTRIVSGSSDKNVRACEAVTGKQLAGPEGRMHWVWSVAFSPDGVHIVSGSSEKTVRLWDAHTGKQLAALEGHMDWVASVAFSPDGAYIVSGSGDKTLRVWDARPGKQLAVLEGHTSWVHSVAFSPDQVHIVSGSRDKTVRLWDARTGKQLAMLEGHTDWVRSVAVSPDRAHIVSGSDDKTVRMWDAHTGEQLAVLEGHKDWVMSVAFSPDGKHIASKDYSCAKIAWSVSCAFLLHEQSQTLVYADTLSDALQLTSEEGPIADLLLTPTEALVWNEASGWISWQCSNLRSVRLCWLPQECRGKPFACHNMTVVIGAQSGALTILDFSEVIAMLKSVDQASCE